jgi:hypothetical protein
MAVLYNRNSSWCEGRQMRAKRELPKKSRAKKSTDGKEQRCCKGGGRSIYPMCELRCICSHCHNGRTLRHQTPVTPGEVYLKEVTVRACLSGCSNYRFLWAKEKIHCAAKYSVRSQTNAVEILGVERIVEQHARVSCVGLNEDIRLGRVPFCEICHSKVEGVAPDPAPDSPTSNPVAKMQQHGKRHTSEVAWR